MEVIAAHLCQCAISLFPYLDDWLIRDLTRNRLISQTKYYLQTVQNLNLKKSDLIPAQKFTFIGMEFLTQQNIVRVPAERVETHSDYQNISFSDSSFSTNFPFSFGQTQCNSGLHFTRQTSFTISANVPIISLETSHSSFRSSGNDQQYDQIPFEMVDGHQSFLQMCLLSVWKPHILCLDHQVTINSMIEFHLKWWVDFVQGIPIHTPDPNVFLYTDASHFGWGAHLDPMSILSWSLVGRPVPAPYQHVGNNSHSFRTDKSLKIYSPFLCHDFYRQHNSGLIYQQARRNTFSQPLCRGMEDPPMVPKTTYSCQNWSYSRQIQCFGR